MRMLVLMEEAYCWATVFSPYGNIRGGVDPTVGEAALDLIEGVTADGGMTGCPAGVLSAARLIPRRSSTRDAVCGSG
jgi:hypothetical protein